MTDIKLNLKQILKSKSKSKTDKKHYILNTIYTKQ